MSPLGLLKEVYGSSLKKEGFILAHSLQGYSSLWWGKRGRGHGRVRVCACALTWLPTRKRRESLDPKVHLAACSTERSQTSQACGGHFRDKLCQWNLFEKLLLLDPDPPVSSAFLCACSLRLKSIICLLGLFFWAPEFSAPLVSVSDFMH